MDTEVYHPLLSPNAPQPFPIQNIEITGTEIEHETRFRQTATFFFAIYACKIPVHDSLSPRRRILPPTRIMNGPPPGSFRTVHLRNNCIQFWFGTVDSTVIYLLLWRQLAEVIPRAQPFVQPQRRQRFYDPGGQRGGPATGWLMFGVYRRPRNTFRASERMLRRLRRSAADGTWWPQVIPRLVTAQEKNVRI